MIFIDWKVIVVSNSLNRVYLQAPLWEFQRGDKVIYSTRPVIVNIIRGENLYFAENEKLRIFVTGESRPEANRAFAEEVVHFYEHYKSLDRDKVTGEAKVLKSLYSKSFKESDA